MQPGDRLICAFVEPQAAGVRFVSWPLHVTIVPWFRLEKSSAQLAQDLRGALQGISVFECVVSGDAQFGVQQNRPVSLLRVSAPLTEMERRTRALFHEEKAWLADESTKERPAFRPHVTVQGSARLYDGDTFICDRLYVVEQKGEYKEVVGEVLFHD